MVHLTRSPTWPRWALLVALLAACSARVPQPLPDAATVEPVAFESPSGTVAIPPGGSRQITLRLLGAQEEPVPGATVNFSILGDQASIGSRDVQLSLTEGLTDNSGAITLQIMAGKGGNDAQPLTFTLRVSSRAAVLDMTVFVTSNALATVLIRPIFPQCIDEPVAFTVISFYDGVSCESVAQNDSATHQTQRLASDADSVSFTSMLTGEGHAVLGVSFDTNNKELARGCADLQGASLTAEQPLLVQLPLARTPPSPVGVYRATSQFDFSTPLPGTVATREVWKILSNDTCDPVRLWLDCTIDALSSDIGDPLDCHPVPDGEGELGTRLMARRSAAGGTGSCASRLDQSGKPSLEAETYALFPASSLEALHLAKLPDELTSALTRLSIDSTLSVSETSVPDEFNIDHTLTAIDLPNAAVHSPIAMMAIGPPVQTARFVSASCKAGQLAIGSHGFTLGLGAAARSTFAASSLAPRAGGVADVSAFVSALARLATYRDGTTVQTGCDALDALLCDDVGQARGCVQAACLSGLEALSDKLDASFASMDGLGLDLFLAGQAPLIDNDGDHQIDALGSISKRGAWNNLTAPTAIKSRKGNTNLYGTWIAERISPTP